MLVRNSLVCAGYLELATQAMIRLTNGVLDTFDSPERRDVRALAVTANRAAYHVSTNALAANCDLFRRDAVLGSCHSLPPSVKAQLR